MTTVQDDTGVLAGDERMLIEGRVAFRRALDQSFARVERPFVTGPAVSQDGQEHSGHGITGWTAAMLNWTYWMR